MVRKLLRIVSILLVLALIFMGSMYYALFVAVNHTEVRYETLRSDKIPESMNDIQILFFTDVEYGAFMNENKLQDVIDTINDAQADVVIFGGDLFDHPEKNGIDEETASSLTEMLKQIDAPLGKYAVLGERDQVSEEVRTQVTQILDGADFELLTNTAIRIRNGSMSGITLIGADSQVNGSPDLSAAFNNISDQEYNIMITHCPDLFADEQIPYASISLGLAGNSHGAQINIPLIGGYRQFDGSQTYSLGKYSISGMELQVSSGVGTTEINARLFSPSEVVVYRLVHTES